MSQHYCLVGVSAPNARENKLLDFFIRIIKKRIGVEGIQLANEPYTWVDSIPGWWNLNQDWFEFYANVNIEWSGIRIKAFSEKEWKPFLDRLNQGKLIMMLSYVEKDEDGNPIRFTPIN